MAGTTLARLDEFKRLNQKFAVLTAYDSTFAALISKVGIEVILVGDSLGMVVQGAGGTNAVTLPDMTYHTRCVANGADGPVIIADMPYMSYATPESATANAAELVRAGAQVVKLEGGAWLAPTIRFMSERGIPVCAHLGLTPQSVDALGGYRVQGREQADADRIIADALELQEAGARLLLLECVSNYVGTELSRVARVPVIGIGAGPGTDAQVLVLPDILGITQGRTARFVKNYMEGNAGIEDAIRRFGEDVRQGRYPAPEHCYG